MGKSVAGAISGRRIKYVFVIFWLAVAALAGPLAGKLTDVERNDTKSWLPGGAESVQVIDVQSSFASPDTIPAIVVYERTSGLTAADETKLRADAAAFGNLAELDGTVTGPIPTKDGQAAQIIVPVNLGADGWSKAGALVDRLRATATAGADGLAVHVAGPAGTAADSSKAFEGIDSSLLLGTIAVVVVILLITYRSPLLWLLPVISSGVALIAAQAVIYLLAKYADLVVNAQSAGILTVLVFGAGTDYALLLIARYREELRRHEDRHEAMAEALHRSGPAIIASAATVVLGMLCLFFAETNSTKGLGPVAAIGIAVGLAVMLTLLPVLLTICGRWIFWPLRPKVGSAEPTATGLWARVGDRIARRPRGVWIVTALVLAVATIGVVQLDATGLTNKESFRNTQDSIVGEEVLARHGAGGAGSPVVVISTAAAAAATKAAFAGVPGIDPASISEPAVKGDVAYVTGDLVAQPDSQAAYDTVDRVRAAVHAVPGAAAKVGGTTAINLDVQRAAKHDRDLIIPIVLAVVLLILILLLRSVLAPVILIATVVLSFGAALGVSALVFRHVFGFGGADTSLPLFVFVFLVALGIDYNIFLMTRVREEAVKHGTRRAALIGLSATGGVITSAGLVLAGTFAVLATLPLTAFAEIGFAVAFGVLLDTIIVRSVLVTALNLDVGERMWWPSGLGRATSPAVPEKDPVAA
ncbi:MMPL family transporter [Dactylosporangium aurantiacum]|uniref:MMPL family transporter n=1 Tax=Dactylosporangium aurantiacum TaxID=35754 RepID=A0A9Q9IMD0_9ACTN|nr:MMPL family transporter [Dactylosporangium aurantiacum]MDG6103076.1 MMPL family transporter [Dactylosporangium aurantiacum]UWZ57588.1 MMPL family transporter [Dactylosporangium aurantiacum]